MVTQTPNDWVLCTLNARYLHTGFGLRYLLANVGEKLQARGRLVEFTINQSPKEIVEAILALNPQVVGFGVYIWNTEPTRQVVSILKKLRPELVIVLGGPEVSHETESQPIVALADHVLCGEAEDLLRRFLTDFFDRGLRPSQKVVRGPLPELKTLLSPYGLYSDEDLKHRVLYVEASRGCPYKCEYCLSSLDQAVRSFDLDAFLEEMQKLLDRGARQFKFVDRTFNLSPTVSRKILEFFLERIELGLFLHFEMVPDRLPDPLKELIRRFPPGSLQFEIGIQTWNPEVAANVSRRQNYPQVIENLRWLRQHSGVHSHVDLIAGLPGESLESFGRGLDAVMELDPDEVQLGILKRLKGTPIIRHDQTFQMRYEDVPPFQILSTSCLSFAEVQQIGRFARFWDQIANSGNFLKTFGWMKAQAKASSSGSLFATFRALTAFLSGRHASQSGVALLSLVESLWAWSSEGWSADARESLRQALLEDYAFGPKRRDPPRFLLLSEGAESPQRRRPPAQGAQGRVSGAVPKRQARRVGEAGAGHPAIGI